MPLPQALLFDNDGVLVQSEPLHRKAWALVMADLGLPFREEDILPLIGKTAPQTLNILLGKYRPGWSEKDYPLDALALRKNDYYLQIQKTELHAYPGIPEGLAWCQSRGIRMAVVSNAKKRELETVLSHLGLARFFEALVSRDDVPAPKPDPMAYLFGAACIETDPQNCIAIEDSPPGLESALRAQVPSAAVLTTFARPHLETPVPGRPDLKPTWIGADPAAFFEWLKSRENSA